MHPCPQKGLSDEEVDRAIGKRVSDIARTGVGAVGSLPLDGAAVEAGNCVGYVDEISCGDFAYWEL